MRLGYINFDYHENQHYFSWISVQFFFKMALHAHAVTDEKIKAHPTLNYCCTKNVCCDNVIINSILQPFLLCIIDKNKVCQLLMWRNNEIITLTDSCSCFEGCMLCFLEFVIFFHISNFQCPGTLHPVFTCYYYYYYYYYYYLLSLKKRRFICSKR